MRAELSVDLQGATAVVTGASRGIGRAIADRFIASGAHVVGLQRHGVSSEHFTAVPVDLSDPTAVEQAAEAVCAEHQVDILVNNAGINTRHRFEEFPLAEFDRVMQVNLRAAVTLTQVVGRSMLPRGTGKIVNLASVLSFFGAYTASAYGTSKGAIAQFTKSVANEWAPHGINVNAVAPGYIRTDQTSALQEDTTRYRQILERIPAGRWGAAEDISGTVLFLASSAADYMHGAVVPVDGGYLAR